MFFYLKCVVALFLPQSLKRLYLNYVFDYEISHDSYVGFSWVFPRKLVVHSCARIGSFNYFKKLDKIVLKESSSIGSLNFFTGFPLSHKHFTDVNRDRSLYIGVHSAITNQHLFDCTDSITIGNFTTVAGYRSQFLTHSIDPFISRQVCAPIFIGDYCFIGTSSTFLKGVQVSNYSIVGASSLVLKSLDSSFCLYAGVPAIFVKPIDSTCPYFTRTHGSIF